MKALEAAEARRKNSRILVAGANRLGGGSRVTGLTPKEMAARVSLAFILQDLHEMTCMQAAEQRIRDEKSCASGALAQREAEKAAKASVESKVIDLTLDDMHDYIYSDFDRDIIIDDDDKGTHRPEGNSSSTAEMRKGWSCLACTFINFPTVSRCEICDSVRPKIKPTEQKAAPPSNNSNPASVKRKLRPLSVITHSDWSCSKCTLDNPHDFFSCAACGTIKAQS